MDSRTKQLLSDLLRTSLRLVETDIDNSVAHQRIADALERYGRRRFGPRFGDSQHKPLITNRRVNDND